MLSVVAARCAASGTAVIATSATPLGCAEPSLRLAGLSQADLAEAVAEPGTRSTVMRCGWRRAACLAWPRNWPRSWPACRPARMPVVHLALTVDSAEPFLTVDTRLVRLIEAALDRGPAAPQRARLLARLAHALLGDASQAARRRELIAEALPLARNSGDPAVLAEVLDARLHALWDPAGARTGSNPRPRSSPRPGTRPIWPGSGAGCSGGSWR